MVTITLQILTYRGIPSCLIGELALNYYNVPRVVHVRHCPAYPECSRADISQDFEICVPAAMASTAAEALCATGLWRPCPFDDSSFNLFTEYKRGSIRLRTTQWAPVPLFFLIFADEVYGLDPLETNSVLVPESGEVVASSQIVGSLGGDDPKRSLSGLRFPRLPPLFRGLARKFLKTGDDMAMIAIEQLVDGMDLDQDWCKRHLSSAETGVQELAAELVRQKSDRLDEFNGNTVTCFIATPEEADRLRRIVGCD